MLCRLSIFVFAGKARLTSYGYTCCSSSVVSVSEAGAVDSPSSLLVSDVPDVVDEDVPVLDSVDGFPVDVEEDVFVLSVTPEDVSLADVAEPVSVPLDVSMPVESLLDVDSPLEVVSVAPSVFESLDSDVLQDICGSSFS